ncbi:MAG: hypothetical protein RLZZ127_2601 [Planctomycetota bacterium]|jgi:hypothetical protein
MDRTAVIEEAIARRNYSPRLRPRIERLLDGIEDRRLLHCCNSGCFVCTRTLIEMLDEIEQRLGTVPVGDAAGACRPAGGRCQPA